MKLYTLMEEHKRHNTAFMAERGFCLYFEQADTHILFDTGPSGSFIYNATLLGIDLSRIDICVISHAHTGHMGGLNAFFEINHRAKVYMRKSAADECYTRRFFRYQKSSADTAFLIKYADRIEFIDSDTEVAPGVTAVISNRYRHLPLYSSLMYKKQDGQIVRDDLSQELFLTINMGESVIVLTGCSHTGILNILITAEEKFGHISGVIGGFHLGGDKRLGIPVKRELYMEIRAIVKYLLDHRIRKVYLRQCTGDKPTERFELLTRAKKLYSGDIIEL